MIILAKIEPSTNTWYSAKAFQTGDYVALLLIAFLLALSIVVTFNDGDRFYRVFLPENGR